MGGEDTHYSKKTMKRKASENKKKFIYFFLLDADQLVPEEREKQVIFSHDFLFRSLKASAKDRENF